MNFQGFDEISNVVIISTFNFLNEIFDLDFSVELWLIVRIYLSYSLTINAHLKFFLIDIKSLVCKAIWLYLTLTSVTHILVTLLPIVNLLKNLLEGINNIVGLVGLKFPKALK